MDGNEKDNQNPWTVTGRKHVYDSDRRILWILRAKDISLLFRYNREAAGGFVVVRIGMYAHLQTGVEKSESCRFGWLSRKTINVTGNKILRIIDIYVESRQKARPPRLCRNISVEWVSTFYGKY